MFSVVIPLYNKELSIANTIQSVLDQTFQDFEIVVVNDGSTDRGVGIVELIDDPRIRIIHQENKGVSAARNTGIREAKKKLIAFLDGDDLWEKNYLEEMNSLIQDFPDCVMYGSSYFVKANNAKQAEINSLEYSFRGIIANYYKTAITGLLFWTSSTIINKSKLIDLDFDERISFGEDLDFWLRCADKGCVVYLNKPLAVYNHDGDNRAMERKHDIKKNFVHYLSKFDTLEDSNKDFKKLINLIRIGKVPEVFLESNASDKQIKSYLSSIDYSEQARRHKFFSFLPFFLKKTLVALKYKNRL